MKIFLKLIKIFYKNRYLVLLVPAAIAILVYIILSLQPRMYKSSTTLYTGVVSGYDVISSSTARSDWMTVNNTIENMVSIIKAESTLEAVYLRLLALNLSNINTSADTEYMTAKSSRELSAMMPQEIKNLVAPGDTAATYSNITTDAINFC